MGQPELLQLDLANTLRDKTLTRSQKEAEARKKKHFAIPLLPTSDADRAQAKALKRAGGFRTDNFKVSGASAWYCTPSKPLLIACTPHSPKVASLCIASAAPANV